MMIYSGMEFVKENIMTVNGSRLIAENRRVEIEEFEYDTPGPGQVLIRVNKSQISAGSEKNGIVGAPKDKRFPLGYITVGTVLESGQGMESFKVGDRVFAFGNHGTHWVTETEELFDDPIYIQHITRDISDEQAAMSRLGDVALLAIRKAELQIDEKVAVFGVGVVGQLIVSFARLSGAYPIIAIDLDKSRLELAKISGATHTIDAGRDDAPEIVKELTNGGAQTVIHANRDPDVLDDCMRAAANRGKVILAGSAPGKAKIGLQVDLMRRSLDIRGVGDPYRLHRYHRFSTYPWSQMRDREAIMRMIESDDLNVDHLISHVSNPEDADDLYQQILDGTQGWMGIFFDWTVV